MKQKVDVNHFRMYYDALYSCTHVHPLINPYPYFQVGLSIMIDCKFGRYYYDMLSSIVYNTGYAQNYPLCVDCIMSYCLLHQVFLDMPVMQVAFDNQFCRWCRTFQMSESDVDFTLQTAVLVLNENPSFLHPFIYH